MVGEQQPYLRPGNCFRVSQVSLPLRTIYGFHQDTTSHEISFWLFWQGLCSLCPATCLSVLCKYHNPYSMGSYLFSSTIHTDSFGAMCCNCSWLWCSERATEHWKFHWEPYRRRYYYLYCGSSNLTPLIWETLLLNTDTSKSFFRIPRWSVLVLSWWSSVILSVATGSAS